MKLSLFAAAPALLLASSAAFAQTPAAPAPAVAPAPAPVAPAPVAPAPVAPAPAVAAEAPTTAAAAPANAPAIDLTTPAPAPAAVPAELPPAPPELAPKLGILKGGWWQPGANLQFWAFGANQAGENTTTFRVRRAELKIKGEIIPKLLAFNVMIDPARALDNNKSTLTTSDGATVSVNNQSNVGILGDFFITVMSDYADVSVGQFKIPVSYEGYNSASKLLFPERSVVSRAYGDIRDMGIRIDKKLGKHFYYQASVFNGEGQNKLDTNKQKDLAGRIEVYPVDGITVGVVGYTGLNHRNEVATTKDRLEADFKLDIANFLLQAEYIHGWDGATGQTTPRREGAGVYAVLGYTIGKVQPLFRIGRYDPDVTKDLQGKAGEHTNLPTGDEVTSYELGLNYYLLGDNAKFQAAWSKYVYKQEPNRGELIIAAQASF